MKKYIRVMRIDHWIKQLFIIPGCICALLLTQSTISMELLLHFIVGFFATCLIASANYVINEWLDAEFDRFHPTKKNRSVVTENVNGKIIWLIWGGIDSRIAAWTFREYSVFADGGLVVAHGNRV